MSGCIFVEGPAESRRASCRSDAVVAGSVAFVSGVLPINIDNDAQLLPELVEHQTEAVLKNLKKILERAGLDNAEVLATTVYTTKLKKFSDRIALVYEKHFPKHRLPTSNWVGVSELSRGALVAMDFIVSTKADQP